MAQKRKFKYGVFDRDGVLIDSMAGYGALFEELSKEVGLNFMLPTAEVLRKITSSDWFVSLKLFLPAREHQLIPLFIEKYDAQMSKVSSSSRMFPAVPPLVAELKRQGLKLFISSFAPTEYVVSSIARYGIDDQFELLKGMSGKVGGESKDSHIQEFADYVDQNLETFASQSFFIGDSPRDMEGAVRNGILAVGITTTHTEVDLKAAGADVVIDKHEDLLNIVAP